MSNVKSTGNFDLKLHFSHNQDFSLGPLLLEVAKGRDQRGVGVFFFEWFLLSPCRAAPGEVARGEAVAQNAPRVRPGRSGLGFLNCLGRWIQMSSMRDT